jgi:hypothetical protein
MALNLRTSSRAFASIKVYQLGLFGLASAQMAQRLANSLINSPLPELPSAALAAMPRPSPI